MTLIICIQMSKVAEYTEENTNYRFSPAKHDYYYYWPEHRKHVKLVGSLGYYFISTHGYQH